MVWTCTPIAVVGNMEFIESTMDKNAYLTQFIKSQQITKKFLSTTQDLVVDKNFGSIMVITQN